MKTILVTGGSGLIGKSLNELKKNNDYFFLIIDSNLCNLINYEETFKLIETIKPNIIIHLAACVG